MRCLKYDLGKFINIKETIPYYYATEKRKQLITI